MSTAQCFDETLSRFGPHRPYRTYQAEWHNMMRPCGLYVTRGKSPLAIVGELGPETVATLTAGCPRSERRLSVDVGSHAKV